MTYNDIPVPLAVAAGASVAVSEAATDLATIQTTGTFVATFRVQGSLDNVNWVNEGAADITAPGAFRATQFWRHFRVNVTVFTSGTPAVRFNCPAR